VTDGVDPIVDSVVGIKYIKYDFSQVLEKEYTNTTGAYQFNLGDSDMLTLSTASCKDDVVILTNEIDDTIGYSEKLVLDGTNYHEHHIVDDGSLVTDTDDTAAEDESINIQVKAIVLREYSVSLYSYYSVEYDGELVYEINDDELVYLPVNTGEHIVTQRAVNKTTGVISDTIWTIDVLQARSEIESIDYVFYSKKKKVLRCELPSYVTDTLVLAPDWYYENGLLIGRTNKLTKLEMDYFNGKVIIKGYIGDILDF